MILRVIARRCRKGKGGLANKKKSLPPPVPKETKDLIILRGTTPVHIFADMRSADPDCLRPDPPEITAGSPARPTPQRFSGLLQGEFRTFLRLLHTIQQLSGRKTCLTIPLQRILLLSIVLQPDRRFKSKTLIF
jgi:hypothetical protein